MNVNRREKVFSNRLSLSMGLFLFLTHCAIQASDQPATAQSGADSDMNFRITDDTSPSKPLHRRS